MSCCSLHPGKTALLTLFHTTDITGAVSAILPLPAPAAPSGAASAKPLLLSAALDQQVRLHSTAPLSAQGAQRGASKKRGATLYAVFAGAAPTAVVWDGVVPTAHEAAEGAADESEDEDLFDNMGVVGGEIEQDSEEEADEAPKKKRAA